MAEDGLKVLNGLMLKHIQMLSMSILIWRLYGNLLHTSKKPFGVLLQSITIWLLGFAEQPYIVIWFLLNMRSNRVITTVALCEARHPIMIEGVSLDRAIYPQVVENPMDFKALEDHAYDWFSSERNLVDIKERDNWEINIYVTGLTPCLIAVLNIIQYFKDGGFNVKPTLYHYNRDTQGYEAQAIHPNN